MLFLHFKGLTSDVYNGNFFNGKTIPVYFSIICCMISFYVACSIKQQTRKADMVSKLTVTAKTNTAAIFMLNTKITIHSKCFLMPRT